MSLTLERRPASPVAFDEIALANLFETSDADPVVRITAEELDQFAPAALPRWHCALAEGLDRLLAPAGINATGQRVAHFMAQIARPCDRFTRREERLGFDDVAELLAAFGEHRHCAAVTPAEAERLLHDPEGLAERVYGIGHPFLARRLGNERPGDGWRYRGRGFLQITGRGSYRRHGQAVGIDLEADPDRAAEGLVALRIAVAEWNDLGCNAAADHDDLERVTRLMAGGLHDMPARRRLLDAAKEIWGWKSPA
jgi:putative chitinase